MRRRKKELLSMEGWTTIRYLQAQGKSIHAIAKELGVTRKVVRRALASAEERPTSERAKQANPKLASGWCQTGDFQDGAGLYARKHETPPSKASLAQQPSDCPRRPLAAHVRRSQSVNSDFVISTKNQPPSCSVD